MITQDLGIATAYGYAKSKGYTGTEVEFAELMASYAEVGQTAVDAAETATTKASEASASASTAQTAANTATTKASEASQSASTAQTASQTATTKASEASTSAQTATTKASEATTKASEASQSASDALAAKTAAETAQGNAESAKTDAETAKADAEQAKADAQEIVDGIQAESDQIVQNKSDIAELTEDKVSKADYYNAFPVDTASGAIASFTDGAELPLKSLVVDIDPVQDLHGQANPYPAGGGKNLANLAYGNQVPSINTGQIVSASGWSCDFIPIDTSKTYTLSFVGTSTQYVLFYDASEGYLGYDSSFASGSQINASTYFSSCAKVKLRSDSPQETNPLMQLEIGSTATAYAPYENICPISGHTQAVVKRTGKNLFNKDSVTIGLMDVYNSEGNPLSSQRSGFEYHLPSGTYTLANSGTFVDYIYGNVVDADRNFVSFFRLSTGNGSVTSTITINDGEYILIYHGTQTALDLTGTQIQIEAGSTATPYESYSGTSINIALGQTVYGGKLDVVSGELVIDRAMVDLGALNWQFSSVGTGHDRFTYADSKLLKGSVCLCDRLQTTTYSDMYNHITDNSIAVHPNAQQVEAYVSAYTDVNSFMSAMTGSQFCYELATPLTITLTPHEVRSLLGSNNVWADTGDTEVTYRADPTLYISRLTEPDADMVADANITSGSYFMVGNTLYKATANIASGGAITPNVNCTRKSLSEALNELNA